MPSEPKQALRLNAHDGMVVLSLGDEAAMGLDPKEAERLAMALVDCAIEAKAQKR